MKAIEKQRKHTVYKMIALPKGLVFDGISNLVTEISLKGRLLRFASFLRMNETSVNNNLTQN